MKYIDFHLDFADLYNSFDLNSKDFFGSSKDIPVSYDQLLTSGVDIVNFTLYYYNFKNEDECYNGVKQYLDFYRNILEDVDKFRCIKNLNDLKFQWIKYFHSLEWFECIRDEKDFEEFYDLWIKIYGPTRHYKNKYGSGRWDTIDDWLSLQWKQLISKFNDKNLVVDIAHLSRKSVQDLEKIYKWVIINSHANVWNIFNDEQNLLDEEIQIIVDRWWIIWLFPFQKSVWKQGTFDEFYRHLDYILQKWGDDNIVFASDMYPLPEFPFLNNYKNIEIWKAWIEFLLNKLSKNTVEKIMYKNWFKFLKKVFTS